MPLLMMMLTCIVSAASSSSKIERAVPHERFDRILLRACTQQ